MSVTSTLSRPAEVDPAAAIDLRGAGKTFVGIDGRAGGGIAPLDLTVAAGELVAVIGRSGCGKSTLLRMIAGLEAPTDGAVSVEGLVIDGPPAAARYVFQNYNDSLLPWKTVRQNVEFGVRNATTPAPTTRRRRLELADEALAEVGLEAAGDKYPAELSGGMQQRVAIARAIASRPRILLMDEPFSAVDALSRATLQDLVLRIWAEHHLTIVFVTHDVDEAIYLADRVVVLGAEGRGVDADLPVDLARPRRQLTTREQPAFLSLRRRALDLVLGEVER